MEYDQSVGSMEAEVPPPALYCVTTNTGGQRRCVTYGNLWLHFKECAVTALETAMIMKEIGTDRPSLLQFASVYKLHTGRSLEEEAIEHGFRSVVDLLSEVPEFVLTVVEGNTHVKRIKVVADDQRNQAPSAIPLWQL